MKMKPHDYILWIYVYYEAILWIGKLVVFYIGLMFKYGSNFTKLFLNLVKVKT